MDRPASLGHLKPDEWERLMAYIDRFEKAWQQTVRSADGVTLNEFLPSANDPLRPAALQELIKTDLEIRWRDGRGGLLEEYLARFPELGTPAALAPQLLYEEYRVRQLFGDHPSLDSYQARFPGQFAALQILVQDQPPPTKSKHAVDPVAPLPAFSARPPGGTGQILSVGGGYEMLEYLGGGGFGNVWRARAPGGVEVAIKRISRPLDHNARQRESQALELIKQLRHPYLLQTHAFYALADELIIAMELADGSLRDRLKEYRKEGRKGIPPRELLGYFREAADGLDFLHSRNVQHRDIKPDNILLQQGHAKVADFGLARFQDMEKSIVDSGSGTPPYTAPEVWLGKIKAGSDSDQYSLAVTYCELRLDRRLYPATALMELMLAHVEGTPDLSPLPEAEQQALLRALEKNPAKRYPTCRDFINALEAALGNELKLSRFDRTSPDVGLVAGSVSPTADVTNPNTIQPSIGAGPPAGSLPVSDTRQERALAPMDDKTQPGWKPEAPAKRLTGKPRLFKSIAMVLLLVCAGIALTAFVREWLFSAPKAPDEVDYLPPKAVKAEGAQVRTVIGGKKYYDRVDVVLPDETHVEFVLIPPNEKVPAPYYFMTDKVSVGLFKHFVATNPYLDFPEWKNIDVNRMGDDKPVMNVFVEDADRFARSLGGRLPSTEQWDTASGSFRTDRGKGPYQDCDPPWDNKIGVSRGRKEGPLANRQGKQDKVQIAEYQTWIYDMAGNGQEWTRDLYKDKESVPLAPEFLKLFPDARVTLRGQSYLEARPIRYELYAPGTVGDSHPYKTGDITIGFRVVIEIP